MGIQLHRSDTALEPDGSTTWNIVKLASKQALIPAASVRARLDMSVLWTVQRTLLMGRGGAALTVNTGTVLSCKTRSATDPNIQRFSPLRP